VIRFQDQWIQEETNKTTTEFQFHEIAKEQDISDQSSGKKGVNRTKQENNRHKI